MLNFKYWCQNMYEIFQEKWKTINKYNSIKIILYIRTHIGFNWVSFWIQCRLPSYSVSLENKYEELHLCSFQDVLSQSVLSQCLQKLQCYTSKRSAISDFFLGGGQGIIKKNSPLPPKVFSLRGSPTIFLTLIHFVHFFTKFF